ncbi:MAG: ribosomal subunit interface protein [Bdellovibrionales bacterium RIFOXYD1_FULL_44_7]|nr:MAG: ribosomal subunit interface protein [Bdellovibrionales bacterium RIFOXYD1_FULL_44_7]
MTLNISFKHLDPTDAIKNYTSEKSEKLRKYFNGKTAISWNFTVEKANHIAHCHLIGNNMNYFGEATTTDLYASIDLAIDKIETQLRKHKEKIKNHHKQAKETNEEESS